jgi:hypothetical protein
MTRKRGFWRSSERARRHRATRERDHALETICLEQADDACAWYSPIKKLRPQPLLSRRLDRRAIVLFPSDGCWSSHLLATSTKPGRRQRAVFESVRREFIDGAVEQSNQAAAPSRTDTRNVGPLPWRPQRCQPLSLSGA